MVMSNKEEMELIKTWWKEYGYYIVFSAVFFLLANFGWRYWTKYKQVRLEHASVVYTQMIEASQNGKSGELKLFGEQLIKKYSSSAYASLGAFILAKNAVKSGDLKSAEEKLQFIIKKSSNKTLRQIARIRAARVMVTMNNPRGALDLLKSVDDSDYTAEISEVFGDALMALGEVNGAEKAYRNAEKLSKERKIQLPLLQTKLRQF